MTAGERARRASGRLAARARWRSVPTSVWGAQVLFVLLLLVASQIFPAYRGPDEPHHVDVVNLLAEGGSFPEPDEHNLTRGVTGSLGIVRFHEGSRNLDAAEAPPRHERPSLDDNGGLTQSAQYNQIAQHPPLYYRVAELWLRAWRAVGLADTFDRTVGVLRFLSVLLVAPAPLLAFLTARRLGATGSAPVAASLVPLAVPQFVHIGSVVNNDSLLVLLLWGLTYAVARVLRGDLTWRTTVAVGGLAAAALLTKALALVVIPWLAIVYALVWWRQTPRRAVVVRRVAGLAAMGAVGAAWWVRNLVVHGEVRPGGLTYDPPPAGFDPDPAWWIELFGRWMSFRFWGEFGWLQIRLPAGLVVAATAVTLGAVAVALAAPRRRGPTPSGRLPARLDLLVLLLPLGGLLAMIGLGAYERYTASGITPGIQGRYLYGGLIGVAVVVGVGLCALFGRVERLVPPALLVAGLGLQAFSFLQVTRFFWGPPGGSLGAQFYAMGRWSPWFHHLPHLLVLLTLAAGAGLLGRLVLGAVRPPSRGRA